MPHVVPPAALLENRSDERQVFELINWLRRQVIDFNAIGGSLLFSQPFDSIYQDKTGNEVVYDQFELPSALATIGQHGRAWPSDIRSAESDFSDSETF